MNSVNFLGQSNFPLSGDTMDFVQEMIFLSSRLALLGGGTYILSGCVENGMNVSDGYLVIDGEIMPFAGGVKQATVYISETRRDVDASGYHFPQVYKSRTAAFGIGSRQYNWTDFIRVKTNTELAASLAALQSTVDGLLGIPAGIIAMWSGSVDNIPAGWALCDGLQGRPNLSGRFIAGFNPNDADYNAVGKTGGQKTATLTTDNIPEHNHIMPWGENKSAYTPPWGFATGYDNNNMFGAGTVNTNNSWYNSGPAGKQNPTPIDSRPPYYVLAYIIKT
jgi:microcystin-dependent protein